MIAMAFPVSFDELNNLVGYERSLSFDKYFGEMRITKAQKQKRKALAQKLEEEMIWLMSYMFYARVQGIGVSMDAINEIRKRYRASLPESLIDLYIASHIDSVSANIVDATNRHKDDPYYYSKDRARYISENEANAVWNYTEYEDAVKNKSFKTWHTIMDMRERESHAEVNGLTIPINDPFELQGGYVMFPRDESMGADDSELISCRCSLSFS